MWQYAPDTMASADDTDAFCTEVRRVIETATLEDKEMVERVQSGAAFGTEATGALHAPQELIIAKFNASISSKIAPGST